MSAKRKKSIIQLITRVSVIGIATITAALVILLSAFNGIESLIEKLYSDFDPSITIRSNSGKTFNPEKVVSLNLQKIEGVADVSTFIEEIIVIKHEKKWVNATIIGVESSFLTMSKMKKHLVDGRSVIENSGQPVGIIGANLLDKLGGFIPDRGMETVQIYAPKRDAKIRIGTNPFSSRLLQVSGRMNFNKEVNTEKLVVPINFTKDLLNYSNSITGIYISINPGYSIENIQQKINEKLGANYSVKTNAEKNELIFKTSKTEKIIVLILLLFIFILAAFNLIASITVLFIEKKGNIQTMIGFGANQKTLFSIFLWEGVLIAGKGILYGLIIGYGICVLQLQTGILTMPNSNGEAFPILLKWADALTIIGSVSLIGFLFSYIPVFVLLKKNFGHLNY